MAKLEQFNQAAFLYLNAGVGSPIWAINTAVFIADYLIFLIPLVLIILWCWGNASQRSLALKACVVALVALGLNQVIILLWPHPRPFMIGLGHTFIAHAPDPSFPSDHATVFAAIGLTLIFGQIRSMVGWMILVMGICVAWARIFLGVHFPLDMLGAVGVVCVTWISLYFIWTRFGDGITRQLEQIYRTILARPISLGWIRS